MRLMMVISIAIATGILSAGCGGGDGKCDLDANTGCKDGKACERVQDTGEPICGA